MGWYDEERADVVRWSKPPHRDQDGHEQPRTPPPPPLRVPSAPPPPVSIVHTRTTTTDEYEHILIGAPALGQAPSWHGYLCPACGSSAASQVGAQTRLLGPAVPVPTEAHKEAGARLFIAVVVAGGAFVGSTWATVTVGGVNHAAGEVVAWCVLVLWGALAVWVIICIATYVVALSTHAADVVTYEQAPKMTERRYACPCGYSWSEESPQR